MARKQKLPALITGSKILSFDIETNNLHGKAFAIGAVVVDANGNVLNEFSGRTEIKQPIDEWVEKNVLPATESIQARFKNYKELKEAFWQWYVKAEPECDYVVLNNGYPVEFRFLLECQDDDLDNRYWQHPFPILDLTSLVLQTGENKKEFMEEFVSGAGRKLHNPLDDATVAALAAVKAFRRTGQIR